MLQFNHFNFNVLDLERSLAFYRQALELEVVEEIVSKLRMKRTLEKYEVSMLFYMLLQKVGSNGVIDA